jgi:hypothetical protein
LILYPSYYDVSSYVRIPKTRKLITEEPTPLKIPQSMKKDIISILIGSVIKDQAYQTTTRTRHLKAERDTRDWRNAPPPKSPILSDYAVP